jgi:hypothetical protein
MLARRDDLAPVELIEGVEHLGCELVCPVACLGHGDEHPVDDVRTRVVLSDIIPALRHTGLRIVKFEPITDS